MTDAGKLHGVGPTPKQKGEICKLVRICVIACQVLKLKCTKYDLGWDSGGFKRGGVGHPQPYSLIFFQKAAFSV